MPHRQSPSHAHITECERKLAAFAQLLDSLEGEIGVAFNFTETTELLLIHRGPMHERERMRIQLITSIASDHLADAGKLIDRMKGVLTGAPGA